MVMATNVRSTVPPTEVESKAKRRSFTAEYKRRILGEADGCSKPGEVGALLRREGLYSSHLVEWRAARDRGELAGRGPTRGPATRRDERDDRIAELEKENARLRLRAEHAEVLVEVQKKVAELLGRPPHEKGGRR